MKLTLRDQINILTIVKNNSFNKGEHPEELMSSIREYIQNLYPNDSIAIEVKSFGSSFDRMTVFFDDQRIISIDNDGDIFLHDRLEGLKFSKIDINTNEWFLESEDKIVREDSPEILDLNLEGKDIFSLTDSDLLILTMTY